MTGQLNALNSQNDFSSESINDSSVDLDEILVNDDNLEDIAQNKEIFSKPADIRRKLEERLEAKNLRDQLGMDDLAF